MLSWSLYIRRLQQGEQKIYSPNFVRMGILVHFVVLSLLLTRVSSLSHSSCSSNFHEGHVNKSGLHLTLHHPRSPCSPAALPDADIPFSAVLLHDDSRVRSLASRLSGHSSSGRAESLVDPESLGVPLNPGASVGVGNYVTKIGLGTPAAEYVVVIDTGSSLSWLQCLPCRISCHEQVGSVFDPSSSSSYRSVSCSAAECDGLRAATLNPSACSASNVCIYEASYGDSSFSVGYLSRDTLSLGGRSAVLPGFVYGCGQDNEGLFGRSAGLIGLARNKLSFLSQLAPKYGNAFSYCLPTAASSGGGYLSIGDNDPSGFSFTPLASNGMDDTLYFIRIASITVAGKAIPVAASAYTGTPTIIDSGTVITRLPDEVYGGLSKAVAAALAKYPTAPAYSILDTCFKGSAKGLAVPEVAIVFGGGAALRLPPKNVMIDVDDGTTCLAFAPAGRVAIVGNRQQQTFKVFYDLARARVGFAAGGCS